MKCTFQPTAQCSINLILKPTLHFNSQIEQDALHCARTYIKLALFLKTPMVLSYTKKKGHWYFSQLDSSDVWLSLPLPLLGSAFQDQPSELSSCKYLLWRC
jgi:hypothetical protein